jgi:alpha-L-rhamnosidase
MYGEIVSDWTIKEDIFDWQVAVPPNTTATVYFPTTATEQITEGGVPLAQAEGVEIVRQDTGMVMGKLVSGNYHFVVKNPVVLDGEV